MLVEYNSIISDDHAEMRCMMENTRGGEWMTKVKFIGSFRVWGRIFIVKNAELAYFAVFGQVEAQERSIYLPVQ
jgi:hypothetical protein